MRSSNIQTKASEQFEDVERMIRPKRQRESHRLNPPRRKPHKYTESHLCHNSDQSVGHFRHQKNYCAKKLFRSFLKKKQTNKKNIFAAKLAASEHLQKRNFTLFVQQNKQNNAGFVTLNVRLLVTGKDWTRTKKKGGEMKKIK